MTTSRAARLFRKVPLARDWEQLDLAPRRFILFHIFNVFSWQCIVGPPMILLAREIAMPPTGVGGLISFPFFSTTLVLVTLPLVWRYGPKKLMLTVWSIRNAVTCVIFLLPWVFSRESPWAGWSLLYGTILSFCLIRAVGAGGWFPWLHEIIPVNQRNAYFSAEMGAAQLTCVLSALFQGLMLGGDPSLNRFMIVYAVGIATGMYSLRLMAKVPGGDAVPDAAEGGGGKMREAYRAVLRDYPYLLFLLVAALSFSASFWFQSSAVLFMRDALGLPSFTIMIIAACGSLGIFVTVPAWCRYAEAHGPAHAVFLSLLGHAVGSLIFLAVLPGQIWSGGLVAVAFVIAFTFSGAFWSSLHALLLDYVQEDGKIAYTNLWTVAASLSLGLTPVAAGWTIGAGGLWGFRACFLISAVGCVVCGVAMRFIAKDRPTLRAAAYALMNPALPVRTMARVAWITAGLHPSNKRLEVEPPVNRNT